MINTILIILCVYSVGLLLTYFFCKRIRNDKYNTKDDILLTNVLSVLSWLGFFLMLTAKLYYIIKSKR